MSGETKALPTSETATNLAAVIAFLKDAQWPLGAVYAATLERLLSDSKVQEALADYDAKEARPENGAKQRAIAYDCALEEKIDGRHAPSRTAKAWNISKRTATQYYSDHREWADAQLEQFEKRSKDMVLPMIAVGGRNVAPAVLSRKERLQWELKELRVACAPLNEGSNREKRQALKST